MDPSQLAPTQVLQSPTQLEQTTSKRARGKAWSAKEDEQLCRSWLDISQDPVVGVEQKYNSLWLRIFNSFLKHRTTTEERTQVGLENRWAIIQKAVSRFCGCIALIESRNQSGKTLEDKIIDAKRLFEESEKRKFVLDHCWVLLRHAKKWQDSLVESDEKKKRQASVVQQTPEPQIPSDNSDEKTKPLDSDILRPQGRKAEKDERSLKRIRDESAKELVQSTKAMVEVSKAKVAAFERANDDTIMARDLTGMDDTSRAYFEKRKKAILARLELEQ